LQFKLLQPTLLTLDCEVVVAVKAVVVAAG
jgi:hypothetical protein